MQSSCFHDPGTGDASRLYVPTGGLNAVPQNEAARPTPSVVIPNDLRVEQLEKQLSTCHTKLESMARQLEAELARSQNECFRWKSDAQYAQMRAADFESKIGEARGTVQKQAKQIEKLEALLGAEKTRNEGLVIQIRDSAAVTEKYIKRSAEFEAQLKECHARIEKQAKELEESRAAQKVLGESIDSDALRSADEECSALKLDLSKARDYAEKLRGTLRSQSQKLADYNHICQIADNRFQELVAKDRRIADLESELKRANPLSLKNKWPIFGLFELGARYPGHPLLKYPSELAQAYRRIQELASKNEELAEQLERQANQAEHFLDVLVNVEQALYPTGKPPEPAR